ncbi:glycolipid transfer protein-like [Pimephales promelas]|uniref:glycolipid transfer protein-like n=1 Tax=Pimephales promelas TaxID=90988 RepID=UPI001955CB97|nr:glycolipid transfer protein-like [Pimephales promelas]
MLEVFGKCSQPVCFHGDGEWLPVLELGFPSPERGLRFIQVLLQSLVDGERDEDNPNLIRINITKAYDRALKRHHGWIVQKTFSRPPNTLRHAGPISLKL